MQSQAPNPTQTRSPAAGGAARPRVCLQGLRGWGRCSGLLTQWTGVGATFRAADLVHEGGAPLLGGPLGQGTRGPPLSSSQSSRRTACLRGRSRGMSSPHPRDSRPRQAVRHTCREGGDEGNAQPGSWPRKPAQQRDSRDPEAKGPLKLLRASLVAQPVKSLPAMWETRVQSLGWEEPREKGKATHSGTLAGELQGLYSPQGRQESNATERLSLEPPGSGVETDSGAGPPSPVMGPCRQRWPLCSLFICRV